MMATFSDEGAGALPRRPLPSFLQDESPEQASDVDTEHVKAPPAEKSKVHVGRLRCAEDGNFITPAADLSKAVSTAVEVPLVPVRLAQKPATTDVKHDVNQEAVARARDSRSAVGNEACEFDVEIPVTGGQSFDWTVQVEKLMRLKAPEHAKPGDKVTFVLARSELEAAPMIRCVATKAEPEVAPSTDDGAGALPQRGDESSVVESDEICSVLVKLPVPGGQWFAWTVIDKLFEFHAPEVGSPYLSSLPLLLTSPPDLSSLPLLLTSPPYLSSFPLLLPSPPSLSGS